MYQILPVAQINLIHCLPVLRREKRAGRGNPDYIAHYNRQPAKPKAEACRCREINPGIGKRSDGIIAVPHKGQSDLWGEREKQEYDEIIALADEVECLSEAYYRGCMYARNRFMVDNSSHCICYLNENTGGTAYTARYAEEQGLQIVNIAPFSC